VLVSDWLGVLVPDPVCDGVCVHDMGKVKPDPQQGHGPEQIELLSSVEEPYVPDGQFVGLLDPAAQYEPMGQSVGAAEFAWQ
jgi:hypothetical protein